jgi:hypothetical protein
LSRVLADAPLKQYSDIKPYDAEPLLARGLIYNRRDPS